MSDKPTAGEWTAETIAAIRCKNTGLVGIGPNDQTVADAHNAALAAAWRKGHADAQAPALERIDELHKQLVAEQLRYRKLVDAERQRCFDLEQQLAAERETAAGFKRELHATLGDLAAEREKWKQENALHLQAVSYYGQSQKALAAEREEHAAKWKWADGDNEQLREELTAEREAAIEHAKVGAEIIKDLREQLAAEKKTVKEYEDYIKELDEIAEEQGKK